MRKIILTPCFVSKGYKSEEALRFSQEGTMVQFRVGMKVYDKRAPENSRWINLNVKAFGQQCERVKSMLLKAGSMIGIEGKFDIDTWEDETSKEKKSAPVMILDDIEYAGGTGKKSSSNENGSTADGTSTEQGNTAPEKQPQKQDSIPENMDNFTGYEPFGGPNPFFPQN